MGNRPVWPTQQKKKESFFIVTQKQKSLNLFIFLLWNRNPWKNLFSLITEVLAHIIKKNFFFIFPKNVNSGLLYKKTLTFFLYSPKSESLADSPKKSKKIYICTKTEISKKKLYSSKGGISEVLLCISKQKSLTNNFISGKILHSQKTTVSLYFWSGSIFSTS